MLFPLLDLFGKIESELKKEKYIIISLKINDKYNYHNWIIYGKTEKGDFLAIDPNSKEKISNVKELVQKMNGTDIMVYDELIRDE